MPFPGSVIPWFNQIFLDDDGNPVANGTVTFKVTGTNDNKDTFEDAQLTTANDNPLQLDASGRPDNNPGSVFLEPGGYDITLKDADGATIRTQIGYEDVGATFLATMGQTLAEGEIDAPDGYVITEDDNTVTALPVAGGDYFLPAVADRGLPLTFINKGAVDANLTLNGSDTFNGASPAGGFVVIPAGTTPIFSGVTIYPQLPSNWVLAARWTI